jgi:hypothetical protein
MSKFFEASSSSEEDDNRKNGFFTSESESGSDNYSDFGEAGETESEPEVS